MIRYKSITKGYRGLMLHAGKFDELLFIHIRQITTEVTDCTSIELLECGFRRTTLAPPRPGLSMLVEGATRVVPRIASGQRVVQIAAGNRRRHLWYRNCRKHRTNGDRNTNHHDGRT